MKDYLLAKNINSIQFDFRKYFTVDALVYSTERIRNEMNENSFPTRALLDL